MTNMIQPTLEYFDCNEGDIQSTTQPTESNLFKPTSLVYAKSAYYYDMHSTSKETSFATIDDNEYSTIDDDYTNNSNKPVKVKIIVPVEDKMAFIKLRGLFYIYHF